MKKILVSVLLLLSIGCKKHETDDLDLNQDKVVWQEWVYEGDSITDLVTGNSYNYPYQLTLLSSHIAEAKQINVSHSGDQVKLMVDQYATEVHPYKKNDSANNYAFAVMAGTNDALFGSSSIEIYSNLKKEWAYARADGFKVFAFCITRSTVTIRDSVGTAVNKLIISDPTLYDYLIRTDLVLPDPTNTYYFPDGLHPSPEGSKLIAQEIINVIKSKQ